MKHLFSLLVATLVVAMSHAQTAVVPPATATQEDYTLGGYYQYGDAQGNQQEEELNRAVKVAIAGSDVYISGLNSYMGDEGWIVGTMNAAKTSVSIATTQFWGNAFGSYPMYFIAMMFDGTTASYPATVDWAYDAATGNFTIPAAFYYMEANGMGSDAGMYGMYGMLTLTKGAPKVPEAVTPPEGIVAQDYLFSATDSYYNEPYSAPAKVAIDGTDVYIQGLSAYLPEGWVKGTLADGRVTFAANQLMGQFYYGGAAYVLYSNPAADAVFTYDAASGTLTAASFKTLASGNTVDDWADITLTRVVEQAATPANPSIAVVGADRDGDMRMGFDVPLVDSEGRPMVLSKLKLRFYTDQAGTVGQLVFKAGEGYYKNLQADMTEVPYGFTDGYDFFQNSIYLYGDYQSWTRVGIQSVYEGGGETRSTDIQWYSIPEGAGVAAVSGEARVVSERFTDLQGRPAGADARGILLRRQQMADGTVRTQKVVRR